MADTGNAIDATSFTHTVERDGQIEHIIFDICGTLFVESTTQALIMASARISWLQALQVLWWRLVACLGRRIGQLQSREHIAVLIRALRGLHRDQIHTIAKELVRGQLTQRDEVFQILAQARHMGLSIGYATYTLAEIAEACASAFGGSVLCASRLLYDKNHICTGTYASQLHGESKVAHLPVDWGAVLRSTTFVTDDAQADAALLQKARLPLVVPIDCSVRTATSFLLSLPGVYYYQTRYPHWVRACFHILKFWLPYVFILQWFYPETYNFLLLFLGFAGWLSVYDEGCLQNDRFAKHEQNGRDRMCFTHDPGVRFHVVHALVVVGSVILASMVNVATGVGVGVLLMCLACVFWLHNRLPFAFRPATFISLYMLKGMVPLVGLYFVVPHWAYMAFALLFSFSYLPHYLWRKTSFYRWFRGIVRKNNIEPDVHAQEELVAGQHVGPFWLRPIFLKNSILVLAYWNIVFFWIWCWVNVLTMLEYAICRHVRVNV